MTDVHNFEKRLENAISGLEDEDDISERNKEIIQELKDECLANGLSTGRAVRHVYNGKKLAKWLEKDFDDADKQDIKELVGTIEQSDYAAKTKKNYKTALKKIYQMLEDYDQGYPDKVSWFKVTTSSNGNKLPDEILTKKEVKRIINQTSKPRDRAFISTLYESGCRIGEFLPLQMKHLEFDDKGAKLMVNGKTGSRRIRVVSSVPYLKKWIDNHPKKDDHHAPIWYSRYSNKRLSYSRARSLIHSLVDEAGIDKRANPHAFRHARATHLANHLTEAQMKEFFGWTQDSNMASTYVHLSGRDVDHALLEMHGIEEPDNNEKEEEMGPRKCPQCEETNPPTNQFCATCGTVLDEEKADEMISQEKKFEVASGAMEQLMEDEEFRDFFKEKLREIETE